MLRFVSKYRWWLILALATTFLLMLSFELSILPKAAADKCEEIASKNNNYCPSYIVAGTFLDSAATFLKPYSDVLTAIAGIIVAAFTATLWITTRQMWRASLAQIAVAERTVDSMVGTERARLYVVIESDTFISNLRQAAEMWTHPSSGDMRLSGGNLIYAFKNYGKTPAFIHEIGHCVIVADERPERNAGPIIPLPVDHVLEPDKTTDAIRVDQIPQLNAGDAIDIADGGRTFWFFGYIRYHDAFNNRWRLDFVWHYGSLVRRLRTYRYEETKE